MRASIIIPVHNRRNDLKECLRAIPSSALNALHTEIIVVDNASTDGVVEMLRDEFPYVHLLEMGENVGPGIARNQATQVARGNLLLFLDSDTVPEPTWLEEMLKADDGVTILVGKTLDFFTSKTQYGPRRSTFIGKSLRCRKEKITMGPSVNLGVPRSIYDAVGGFWEEISFAFEDSFFCLNAKHRGFKFRYVDAAVVRHKGTVKRRGAGIQITEHNGVFAMLTFYKGSLCKQIVFTVANGFWLLLRCLWWSLSGHCEDARLLFAGWITAYKRYFFDGCNLR